MSYKFNASRFAKDVAAKREGITVSTTRRLPSGPAKSKRSIGLRPVADEIGISATTLMRIEFGFLPDIGTFAKVCTWLKESPDVYFDNVKHNRKTDNK